MSAMMKNVLAICQKDRIVEWLNDAGYSVTVADNLADAMQTMERQHDEPFYLVLCSDMAPDMALADFLKHIKSSLVSQTMFVLVVLEGTSGEEAVDGLVDAGADDFLFWPVSKAVFFHKLRLIERVALFGRYTDCDIGKNSLIVGLLPGIVHEINNPVAFVSSNLSVMDDYISSVKEHLRLATGLADCLMERGGQTGSCDGELDAYRSFAEDADLKSTVLEMGTILAESREGMQQIESMLNALREFAFTEEEMEPGETDIHQCIETALQVMKNRIKYKADVAKEYGDLPGIKGFPGRMIYAFVIILDHAVGAIDHQGNLHVRTCANNGRIMATIEVNGCKADSGAPAMPGIGLDVARSVIHAHGGELGVKMQPDSGLIYEVSLPAEGKVT